MTLDLEMAEIAKVFFQESREGLDVMESGLLSLGATADPENINTIFRAAHSIKGGSATFGFAEVADFTHGVETLLDEMRNGVREVTTEAIQALLQSCDCLREMIAATEAEQPLDQGRIASLKNEINRILSERNGEPLSHAPAPTVPAPIDDAADPGATGWRIVFQPVADLLRLRNEPTRLFAELERLGKFAACADVSQLPSLDALDPESCYLSWNIELAGQIPKHKLDEIFDWVDTRCQLEFIPHRNGAPPVPVLDERLPAFTATIPPLAETPPFAETLPTVQPASAPVHKTSADAGSIRVATQKIDQIINLVGELLITQSMLCGFAEGFDPSDIGKLRQGLAQLARNSRELQ